SSCDWRFTADNLTPTTLEQKGQQHSLADAERNHITTALRLCRGVIGGRNGAAVRLGLPRTTLMAKMKRLGISLSDSHLTFVYDGSIDPLTHYRFSDDIET